MEPKFCNISWILAKKCILAVMPILGPTPHFPDVAHFKTVQNHDSNFQASQSERDQKQSSMASGKLFL